MLRIDILLSILLLSLLLYCFVHHVKDLFSYITISFRGE